MKDVAEILHVGPCDKEVPTIKRLTDFVREQGYEVVGPQEEEFLKGALSGRGDQEKYARRFRYQVRKLRERG